MIINDTTGKDNSRIYKAAAACFVIAFLMLMAFLGREILFPILMSLLFAILLRPIVSFLHTRLRFPHMLAVILAVINGILVLLTLIYFLSTQISVFMNDLPHIKKNILLHFDHIQSWIQGKFKISSREQKQYIESTMNSSSMLNKSSIGSLTGSLLNFILIPIYTFLILIYRTLFLKFLIQVFDSSNHALLAETLGEIKLVVKSYVTGLMLELLIVAAMTSVGLWLIGVPYFIFLGILTAILNLIPYVGILIAGIVSILVALVSSTELGIILGVIGVNAFVQLVDNNILIPKIVGSKVKMNALASIVAVIIGGHLAGVAGMFLAIPVIAILKVIFDRIDNLKPIGFLLGDNIPKTFNWRKIRLPDLNAGGESKQTGESREIL